MSFFEELYSGGDPPWDLGRPQRAFVDVAGEIGGDILDAGCGTGEHALFFAARGHRVVGVDNVATAIERARTKAIARGVSGVTFLVHDALEPLERRFDTVIDCGLFHVFRDPSRYVASLARMLEPKGKVFVLCFSEAVPGTGGPRRVSKRDLETAFSQPDFTVLEVRPALFEAKFRLGAAPGWLAIVERSC